jgi:RNA polymerase sigma-70 factor (ECF subfamily)
VLLGKNRFTTVSIEQLYEQHGAALAAYGCCCGLDFGSAEDVVQQIFLKLLEGNAAAVQTPLPYLYRSVRNTAMNYRRDRQRETQVSEGELWFNHSTADRTEVLSLQNALRELPEEQQEAVFLRAWSGMTLQEIADATGTPLNTVASRYRYALEKLRERLGKVAGKARIDDAER